MDQFVYLAFVHVLGEGNVISRDRQAIGVELDVFVPPSFAVELGSWSWHKNKIDGADAEKRRRCEEKGIKLFTVYDSVPQGVAVPEGCRSYPFDLASEEGHASLIELTKELLYSLLDGRNVCLPDWRAVEREAVFRTGVRSHMQFVARLKEISPTIRIESEYLNDRTKIECKCEVCGRMWKAAPNSLLQRHGCPSCSAKRTADGQRKSHATFAREVSKANSNVELLGNYEGDSVKIACRCKICGNEWTVRPNSLRKGHGCPKCGLESSIKKRRKSHGQFIAELAKINPSVEVVDQYVNTTTKIECSCKTCGHRWRVVPDSLLQGTGCPKCGQRRSHDAQRKNHKQFVKELAEINPSVEVLCEYTRAKGKIECLCKVCNHRWSSVPDRLLHGMGCPECGKKKRANSRRKTHEQFIVDLEKIQPTIDVVGRYEGKAIKILCRCKVCGHEWEARPDNLLSGRGCPGCKAQNFVKRTAKNRKAQQSHDASVLETSTTIPLGSKTASDWRKKRGATRHVESMI